LVFSLFLKISEITPDIFGHWCINYTFYIVIVLGVNVVLIMCFLLYMYSFNYILHKHTTIGQFEFTVS